MSPAKGVFDLVEEPAVRRLLGDLAPHRLGQALEQVALLNGQLAWGDNLNGDDLITAVTAAEIRHAPTTQAKLLAGLRAGRQRKGDWTIDRLDFQVVAERG